MSDPLTPGQLAELERRLQGWTCSGQTEIRVVPRGECVCPETPARCGEPATAEDLLCDSCRSECWVIG